MSKVTVLGLNGHVGRAAVAAFADAGWEVTGFGRTNRHPDQRVRFVKGDADNVVELKRAIAGADVVFNALNLPYDKWDQGRAEAQVARVVEAVSGSGATLVFPGNIYNYAASERVVTPASPQNPETARGAIRVRAEQIIQRAAQRGELKAIILRAGDFYGPDCEKDWFDQAILREAGKGRVASMGRSGVGHAWAYLPDVARAAVALAGMRAGFDAFELFHFAGHFATPEQMVAAIKAATPMPLKAGTFPWFVLTLMGLADPVIREVNKMRYLWENPMELSDTRLDALLGKEFGTPFADAVGATVRTRFFPAVRKAA